MLGPLCFTSFLTVRLGDKVVSKFRTDARKGLHLDWLQSTRNVRMVIPEGWTFHMELMDAPTG